jgi:ribosome-binding protein aMBF1 (putative translation factor)
LVVNVSKDAGQLKDESLPNLKINPDGMCNIIKRAGLANNELARLIGVDRSVVSRVLRGEVRPGNRFIAGMWSLFGIGILPELFTMEEED